MRCWRCLRRERKKLQNIFVIGSVLIVFGLRILQLRSMRKYNPNRDPVALTGNGCPWRKIRGPAGFTWRNPAKNYW
jgi:hypothetical protein